MTQGIQQFSRILVTGGAGFVGSNLACGLRRAWPGATVLALDNLRRRGSELNLPRLRDAGVVFQHGDIRNPEDLDAAGPVDLLVECSAEPSVLAGLRESPRYLIQTNLTGMFHCLEAARRHGAAIVFLSTSRVYPLAALNALAYSEGDTRFVLEDTQPFPGVSAAGVAETFPLAGPRSLYGATKLAAELLLEEYVAAFGVRGVVNRCGVIAGPWQMGRVEQGVVALWAARHVFGGRLDYVGYGGRGKQVRDVLHVDDLLDLVLYEAADLDAVNGRVFNAGGGVEVSTSLLELTTLCRELSGNVIEVGHVAETRPADIPIFITDHAAVTRATGWQPRRGLRTIVADIIAWLRAYEDALRPVFL